MTSRRRDALVQQAQIAGIVILGLAIWIGVPVALVLMALAVWG